jgi:Rad3-related DNA helicase
MSNTYKWAKSFPYPEFRTGQDTVINKILGKFNEGKKFAILEAPTGAGKSAIGYTIGDFLGSYYYITAQKILQTQLSADFGEGGIWARTHPMIELKGRNAYPCNYYQRKLDEDPTLNGAGDTVVQRFKDYTTRGIDCATGACKKKGKSKFAFCEEHCPYFVQKGKAVASDATLMNFHSFIFQTEMTGDWGNRTLLIIDECHNTEKVLLDYVTLQFNDKPFGLVFLEYSTAEEYYMFFEENDIPGIIRSSLEEAITKNDVEDEAYWSSIATKYSIFKRAILSDDSEDEWIAKFEECQGWNTVTLKPLFVKKYAEELIFSKADKVLMMSATVLNADILRDSLGIAKNQCFAHRTRSTFPVENRPIFFTPSGSMNYKHKAKTIPVLISDINSICKNHSNERGIIHTHNFEIAKILLEKCSPDVKCRFHFQEDYDSKEEMLKSHAKSKNGIIVAPAMHEGLDLKDDLSRFQIICKVPYPSFVEDPQLKRRMEISDKYYQYVTALKLWQSYGRSVRSETDYAKTYVLDKEFENFAKRAKGVTPAWIKEAIVW